MSVKTSIITPVRDGAAYIAQAVQSVLHQLGSDDEFFIIDDGSSDDTCSIVNAFDDPRIRLVASPRRGVSAARNAGLALATGAFVSFFDSDDEWPAGRHAAMLDRLAENPALDAVFGRLRIQLEPDAPPHLNYDAADGKFIPKGVLGTGLFRLGLVRRVGGFAEDMQHAEDVDFYNRLDEAGMRVELIDVDALIYRRHGTNATNDQSSVKRGFLKMLRRKLARARARAENQGAVA